MDLFNFIFYLSIITASCVVIYMTYCLIDTIKTFNAIEEFEKTFETKGSVNE